MPTSARALRLALGQHAQMLIATFVSLGLASSASLAQDLPLALAGEEGTRVVSLRMV